MMHAHENRYGFGWLASQLAAVRLSGAGVVICIAGYQLSDYTHTGTFARAFPAYLCSCPPVFLECGFGELLELAFLGDHLYHRQAWTAGAPSITRPVDRPSGTATTFREPLC